MVVIQLFTVSPFIFSLFPFIPCAFSYCNSTDWGIRGKLLCKHMISSRAEIPLFDIQIDDRWIELLSFVTSIQHTYIVTWALILQLEPRIWGKIWLRVDDGSDRIWLVTWGLCWKMAFLLTISLISSLHPSPLNWSNSTKTNSSANLPLHFERNSLLTSLESLHLGRSGKCFGAFSSLILSWDLFLKSPETFWVYFRCHSSLYIFAIPRF